jgi:hypothetical protein
MSGAANCSNVSDRMMNCTIERSSSRNALCQLYFRRDRHVGRATNASIENVDDSGVIAATMRSPDVTSCIHWQLVLDEAKNSHRSFWLQ